MQNKCWHYLFEVASLRGCVEPELSHPLWNAFKRSARQAGLETSILKLTVISNFGHGSFNNGDHHFTRREVMEEYLNNQTDEWFECQAENWAFDKGTQMESDWVPTAADWLESPALTTRGLFAAWLQCLWICSLGHYVAHAVCAQTSSVPALADCSTRHEATCPRRDGPRVCNAEDENEEAERFPELVSGLKQPAFSLSQPRQ